MSVVESWEVPDRGGRAALLTFTTLLGVGLVLGNGWVVWHVTRLIDDLTGVELLSGTGVAGHVAAVITWPHWHVTLDYGWTYLSLLPLVLIAVVAYSLVKRWLLRSPTRRRTFWIVWVASAAAGTVIGIGQLLWSILMDYLNWPIWWMLLGSLGDLIFLAEGVGWDALWYVVYAAGWGVMAGGVAAAIAAKWG